MYVLIQGYGTWQNSTIFKKKKKKLVYSIFWAVYLLFGIM